jgi:Lipocalin-like domain
MHNNDSTCAETEMIDSTRLIGTWRLVSAVAFAADGRPLPPPYGPEPMGRLVLTERGRMMAVLCDGRAKIPEGEKRAYSSYCGNFRVEDNILITIVDAAAIAERLGSEQRRKLDFRNGELVLIPPPRQDGERRELFWKLNGPA